MSNPQPQPPRAWDQRGGMEDLKRFTDDLVQYLGQRLGTANAIQTDMFAEGAVSPQSAAMIAGGLFQVDASASRYAGIAAFAVSVVDGQAVSWGPFDATPDLVVVEHLRQLLEGVDHAPAQHEACGKADQIQRNQGDDDGNQRDHPWLAQHLAGGRPGAAQQGNQARDQWRADFGKQPEHELEHDPGQPQGHECEQAGDQVTLDVEWTLGHGDAIGLRPVSAQTRGEASRRHYRWRIRHTRGSLDIR